MQSVLPISNVINVTIANTPQGFAGRNVNNGALFSNEVPNFIDLYRQYISPAAVGEDWGTNSLTYAMAVDIFSQSPNIRTGDGMLTIIPMNQSVNATAGRFVTADISANLAAIIAVTSGDLKVTMDGTAHNLVGLNFSNCADLGDVAEVLQNALLDAVVTAPTAATLRFESKRVGTDSTVALAAVAGGTGTALNGAGYFNAAAGTATPGVDSTGETLVEAIARVQGSVSFTGIMTTMNLEDDAIEDTAAVIQSQDMMFLHHISDYKQITGLATNIEQASQRKTRILLKTDSIASANLMKAAYFGRGFSVNFDGSKTSQTMNLKQLVNITPDSGINQTLYNLASIAGVDLYVSYDGVPSVVSNGGNDYFDNVYNDIALKFALETAGFNYLRQTNTKVPQTEQGMNGLKAVYAGVCEAFIFNGCIAPGSWQSSETFGDPVVFKQNVLTTGYYIYSLPIVQQAQEDREARKAPLVQIAIKRAGAIHSSDVLVIIND